MKYSYTQALSEIMRRGSGLAEQRRRRRFLFWAELSGCLLLLLAVTVTRFAGTAEAGAEESVYGAFILSGLAGGYVLTGVIAFAAGVSVTLACLKYKQSASKRPERDEPGDGESDR